MSHGNEIIYVLLIIQSHVSVCWLDINIFNQEESLEAKYVFQDPARQTDLKQHDVQFHANFNLFFNDCYY